MKRDERTRIADEVLAVGALLYEIDARLSRLAVGMRARGQRASWAALEEACEDAAGDALQHGSALMSALAEARTADAKDIRPRLRAVAA